MIPESNKTADRPTWGKLPKDLIASLKRKYWCHPKKLKSLLKDDSVFPLQVSLQPPRGNAVLEDINHFQTFVASWKEFSGDESKRFCEVFWERRSFRSLSEQAIPTRLSIADIAAFAGLMGEHEAGELRQWQAKIAYVLNALAPFCSNNKGLQAEELNSNTKQALLFDTLIDHLDALHKFAYSDLDLLVKLFPQVAQGMGGGGYLRALPVIIVDTKFIENNLRIIESVAAAVIDEAIADVGLLNWLHCKDKPKDWLLIKPLCRQTKAALGGVPLLRLSSDTLLDYELPAKNILIIENEQSCLSLSEEIPDTIAVAGGGKNLIWMRAAWLATKKVAYWGDIDSEGLSILSDARSKLSTITPLMMDIETVENYQERMVAEPDSVLKEPVALTERESVLFRQLRSEKYANKRLEQERLPMEYIVKNITCWISRTR